ELADKQTNYIFVNFVGGPKFDVTTDRTAIELNRQFTLGRVYRDGNDTHIIQSGVKLPNFLRKDHERLLAVRNFERASGGVISESGNRYLDSTGGIFYLGTNKITTTEKDTNNGDTFTRHYHAAGPVWTSDIKSQIAEGGAGFYKYDDGTQLQNLSNNKYGVFWVFIDYDGHLHVVVGRGDYTLLGAQEALVPALPNIVNDFSKLAAKIILLEDGTNFIAVQGAYETLFPMNGGINHNDLGGIQGGAADDYYHLTSAEETAATRDATNAVKGLATAAQITKLEGIATGANVTGDNPPQAHKTSHESGGGDAIKLDDLAAPDDNVDLDFSITKHGLTPKGTNVGKFLKDDGSWGVPAGGDAVKKTIEGRIQA
ncbi:unnamed protein product, partial [marine sediment metagenome]